MFKKIYTKIKYWLLGAFGIAVVIVGGMFGGDLVKKPVDIEVLNVVKKEIVLNDNIKAKSNVIIEMEEVKYYEEVF